LFVVVLAIYLFNQRFNETTDTFGNELLPISILEQHTLTFDQYYVGTAANGQYPTGENALASFAFPAEEAYRISPETASENTPWWFVRSGGHVLSLFPIAPGVLNTPVMFLATVLGVSVEDNVISLAHITTSALAALSVAFMYVCLVQVCARQRAAVFLTLNFAFATAVWSANSRTLNQHGASVLFLAATLAALVSRRTLFVVVAGCLVSLAVVTRPTNFLFAAPLALYVFRHERAAFPGFATLAAIPALLLGWYSWVYWGTPLALGESNHFTGFTAPEPAVAAVGLLLSPNRGLLVFSPILIFSVAYSAYLVIRRRSADPLPRYLIWSAVAVFALYTVWLDWAGGHTYGYRFLIDLLPALTLILALCWERVIVSRAYLRATFMVAMVASIYVHGLGAAASPCGFDDDPNNIDLDHARLWDVTNGEIARCTVKELVGWEPAFSAH
jgi:hypothetical protein